MRWRRATAPVVACALAVAGCGVGSTGEPSPAPASHTMIPRGFTRTTAGPVSFAYPVGWRRGTAPAGASVVVQRTQGQVVYAQAAVLTKVIQADDPEVVGDDAYAAVPVTAVNANRGPFRPVSVPGATKAVRLDYTFQSTANEAASRGTDLSVVYSKNRALVLRISGLRTALSDVTVEHPQRGDTRLSEMCREAT